MSNIIDSLFILALIISFNFIYKDLELNIYTLILAIITIIYKYSKLVRSITLDNFSRGFFKSLIYIIEEL